MQVFFTWAVAYICFWEVQCWALWKVAAYNATAKGRRCRSFEEGAEWSLFERWWHSVCCLSVNFMTFSLLHNFGVVFFHLVNSINKFEQLRHFCYWMASCPETWLIIFGFVALRWSQVHWCKDIIKILWCKAQCLWLLSTEKWGYIFLSSSSYLFRNPPAEDPC